MGVQGAIVTIKGKMDMMDGHTLTNVEISAHLSGVSLSGSVDILDTIKREIYMLVCVDTVLLLLPTRYARNAV